MSEVPLQAKRRILFNGFRNQKSASIPITTSERQIPRDLTPPIPPPFSNPGPLQNKYSKLHDGSMEISANPSDFRTDALQAFWM
jgi:hypothetical protein